MYIHGFVQGWRRVLLALAASLLALLSPALAHAQGPLEWRPGTLIKGEYKELAGTISLDASAPPVLWSDGKVFQLILGVQESEIPNFKNKTPAIMKGIAGTLVEPGHPTQYLFWPMSCTIRTETFVFPDPSDSYRAWFSSGGRE